MSVRIAIPVHRIRCRIWTDESRDWSVVHEALMLALARAPCPLESLGRDVSLPKQVVVAAVARLMQHRLIEVVLAEDAVAFQASPAGLDLVRNGRPLPRFPREVARTYGFVVERFSGGCFFTRELDRLARARDLDARRANGESIKVIDVAGGAPHEVTVEALIDMVERGGERRLLRFDGEGSKVWSDRFMLVNVVDGVPKLPESARQELRDFVADAAASEAGRIEVASVPRSDGGGASTCFAPVLCDVSPSDIVVGGPAHRDLVHGIIGSASSRVVVHSTFLDAEKFRLLAEIIRSACARGVRFDLLWGEEAADPATSRNAASAVEIAREVAADPVMRGWVRMRMGTTGSHAKIILADRADGTWCAAVGSCNWISSPFRMVEASVVLHHPLVVADVVTVLQRTVGRRPLADDLANELALTANDLRRNRPDPTGNATVTVLVGGAHEALMRRASGEPAGRFFVGTHRVSGNVRPAALLPAALAAAKGAEAAVLYTQPNKPMTRQDARAVAAEAAGAGVRVTEARKISAHAKVLLRGPDDVVVTSRNWGSASTNYMFPMAEVGVHVQAPGFADAVLAKFETIYPNLWDAT